MSDAALAPWLAIFKAIGAAADEVVRTLYRTDEAKKELSVGAGGDVTLAIDKALEDVVIQHLTDALPDIKGVVLISEEAGTVTLGAAKKAKYAVIADPLDGSLNAKEGLPLFAISLALAELDENGVPTIGRLKVGYIRNLISGDEYWGVRGDGAFWNGESITASQREKLEMLGIELYPDVTGTLKANAAVIEHTKRIRSIGSMALDFCFVAHGFFDAFVDLKKKSRLIDIVAGIVIVEEAGGMATDSTGHALRRLPITLETKTGLVVSGNATLHATILAMH